MHARAEQNRRIDRCTHAWGQWFNVYRLINHCTHACMHARAEQNRTEGSIDTRIACINEYVYRSLHAWLYIVFFVCMLICIKGPSKCIYFNWCMDRSIGPWDNDGLYEKYKYASLPVSELICSPVRPVHTYHISQVAYRERMYGTWRQRVHVWHVETKSACMIRGDKEHMYDTWRQRAHVWHVETMSACRTRGD